MVRPGFNTGVGEWKAIRWLSEQVSGVAGDAGDAAHGQLPDKGDRRQQTGSEMGGNQRKTQLQIPTSSKATEASYEFLCCISFLS